LECVGAFDTALGLRARVAGVRTGPGGQEGTESLSFSTAEGSLVPQNQLPSVQFRRIKDEKKIPAKMPIYLPHSEAVHRNRLNFCRRALT